MKTKTKLSTSLLIFIGIGIGVVLYLSFIFYQMSVADRGPVTKVASTNYHDIDSLKSVAVADTVQHFRKEIEKINQILSDRDSSISQLRIKNGRLQRNFDSVDNKLDFYRQKSREKRNTTDSLH